MRARYIGQNPGLDWQDYFQQDEFGAWFAYESGRQMQVPYHLIAELEANIVEY